jgi:hypothetical protein
MTTFAVGKPVTTDTSSVTVDAGLPVGLHRFRLEVVDSAGKTSAPNEVVVQVVNTTTPVRLGEPGGATKPARKTESKTRSKR